ncbi:MAG: hypothetical protein ACREUY_03785 [Burkholderiales bacterium]
MLADAESVVAIPAPGEAFHGIMTGAFDLMHVVLAILNQADETCQHLRIATLSYNRRNLTELLHLLDTGSTKKLSLICSRFFREHGKEFHDHSARELSARPGTRFAAPRSHCKVICFDFGENTLALEGSANLRTNGNWEQFVLINDRQLHNWHAAWIDGLLDKHESH